jgi:hypothetical protein
MTRYNGLFVSKFRGCRLLASFEDEYQKCQVKVFLLPGEYHLVGVSVGGDCHIVSPQYSLHKVSKLVLGLLEKAQRGLEVGTEELKKTIRVILNPTPTQITRRELHAKPRTRTVLRGASGRVRRELSKS